jgi:hypothetical protein
MKILQTILIVVTALACSSESQKVNNQSSFDLKRDIYNLSQKLNNGDTIFFEAALGVCVSTCREINAIFKSNDSILIQSKIVDIYPNDETKELKKAHYLYNSKDTLNFENLFYSMKEDVRVRDSIDGQTIFEVRFQNDTVDFYPKDLVSVLRQIYFYSKIKERLYPEEEIYKPVLIKN